MTSDKSLRDGLFTATAVDGWFNVDFADTGYEAGTNWMDTTFVSNPGGTWPTKFVKVVAARERPEPGAALE